jgi:hypothetical protein
MAQRVYVESTIPSYLASRLSGNLRQAARQHITRDWWDNHRHAYDLCISQLVIDEVSAGDPDAAQRRLAYVDGLPLLDLRRDGVHELAQTFIAEGALPVQAGHDAMHIAVATVHFVEIVLTWNCRHIANGRMLKEMERTAAEAGYPLPVLCTPEQLIGE